jgi:hypothetical protein
LNNKSLKNTGSVLLRQIHAKGLTVPFQPAKIATGNWTAAAFPAQHRSAQARNATFQTLATIANFNPTREGLCNDGKRRPGRHGAAEQG